MKLIRNMFFYLAPLLLTGLMAFECGKELDPPAGKDDNTEIPAQPDNGEEPEPTPRPYYVKVTENLSDWSGEYLIAYESEGDDAVMYVFADWDPYGQAVMSGVSKKNFLTLMDESGLPAEEGDPYKAVITKDGSHYIISVSNVGYIGYSGSSNSLSKADTVSDNCKWTISYSEGHVFIESAQSVGRILRWNPGSPRFACYKDSSNQQELTLYKRTMATPPSGGGTAPDPETPTPDPEDPDSENPDADTPDVPPTEPVPGISGIHNWYELPAISYSKEGDYYVSGKDSDTYGKLYYAHHHCDGDEHYLYKGKSVKARNYTVCFSSKHHVPVWVAAPRHTMYESGASRKDAYGKDPSIPSGIQYNSTSTGGGCNKGHMLGSAERLSSTETNRQVFYYTNIAPQYSDTFNTGGGGWNTLEDWVDGQVCSDTLYVVIGAYFDQYTDPQNYSASPKTISFGGRDDVSCPTMFYYALLRTKKGNSGKALSECSSSEMKCAAFVRSHKIAKGTKVSKKEMMSVSDLEKITGFTYFPNVPNAPKTSYNASDWGL